MALLWQLAAGAARFVYFKLRPQKAFSHPPIPFFNKNAKGYAPRSSRNHHKAFHANPPLRFVKKAGTII
jgi:hypothetical protein